MSAQQELDRIDEQLRRLRTAQEQPWLTALVLTAILLGVFLIGVLLHAMYREVPSLFAATMVVIGVYFGAVVYIKWAVPRRRKDLLAAREMLR